MFPILLERGLDVNSMEGDYGTALASTAARGHKEIGQMLLKAGADVNWSLQIN